MLGKLDNGMRKMPVTNEATVLQLPRTTQTGAGITAGCDQVPDFQLPGKVSCGCSTFPTAKPRIMPHVSVCVRDSSGHNNYGSGRSVILSAGQWALNWLRLSQVCQALRALSDPIRRNFLIFPFSPNGNNGRI